MWVEELSYRSTAPLWNEDSYLGHTYFMSYALLTFEDAEAYCSDTALGGYLALPDDDEEREFLEGWVFDKILYAKLSHR